MCPGLCGESCHSPGGSGEGSSIPGLSSVPLTLSQIPRGLRPCWKSHGPWCGQGFSEPRSGLPPRAGGWARPGPLQAWLEGPTYPSSASGCSAGPAAAAAASGPASSSDKERGAGLEGSSQVPWALHLQPWAVSQLGSSRPPVFTGTGTSSQQINITAYVVTI